MKAEIWNIDRVKPYADNPRVIPEEAVTTLAESMLALGFRDPIEVDKDGVVLAGHTRLLAARKLNLERVPVIIHDDLTPEEAKAYRVSNNRLGENTSWNTLLLAEELRTVEDAVTLDLLGFKAEELGKLFAEAKEAAEPAPAKEAGPDGCVCRPGDEWVLGDHRLVIGKADPGKGDLVIQAWQRKTKAKAMLGGKSFSEVRADRAMEWGQS